MISKIEEIKDNFLDVLFHNNQHLIHSVVFTPYRDPNHLLGVRVFEVRVHILNNLTDEISKGTHL